MRREIGLNQEELAKKLGVSKRTVQNYENADMYPKSRGIYGKMADLFGVDVNYLLTEDEKFIAEATYLRFLQEANFPKKIKMP